jgi:hypothetical protein
MEHKPTATKLTYCRRVCTRPDSLTLNLLVDASYDLYSDPKRPSPNLNIDSWLGPTNNAPIAVIAVPSRTQQLVATSATYAELMEAG